VHEPSGVVSLERSRGHRWRDPPDEDGDEVVLGVVIEVLEDIRRTNRKAPGQRSVALPSGSVAVVAMHAVELFDRNRFRRCRGGAGVGSRG
jgi:hypothetical protein